MVNDGVVLCLCFLSGGGHCELFLMFTGGVGDERGLIPNRFFLPLFFPSSILSWKGMWHCLIPVCCHTKSLGPVMGVDPSRQDGQNDINRAVIGERRFGGILNLTKIGVSMEHSGSRWLLALGVSWDVLGVKTRRW